MLKIKAFICGSPHSGTTLLANMFAAHPQVYTPLRETAVFYSRIVGARLLQLQLATLLRGKRYLVEKTPAHITKIETIRAHAPGAKIIMLLRNPCDVAASHFTRYDNADRGIDSWIQACEIIEAENAAPDTILLRYEELIVDPEAELRRLCDFIGMPYSPGMLNYHEKGNLWFGSSEIRKASGKEGDEHRLLRTWQVNQPLFDGREKWRAVFDAMPERLATGQGKELRDRFGYGENDSR